MHRVLRQRQRPTSMPVVMPLLLAVIVSCRNDAVESPTCPQSPEVAVSVPATVIERNPAEAEPAPAGPQPVAANPFGGCDMCHVDVEDEFVGTKHDVEGVGCVKCHGPSEGHVADENNEVLPDRMFADSQVDSFCLECHECSRPAASQATTANAEQKVCTACHGAHDLRLAGK